MKICKIGNFASIIILVFLANQINANATIMNIER